VGHKSFDLGSVLTPDSFTICFTELFFDASSIFLYNCILKTVGIYSCINTEFTSLLFMLFNRVNKMDWN
jgi:hypothetical protein